MSQLDLNKVKLAEYDYVILVDRSGSMDTEDCPGNKSRWEQAKEWGKQFATQCEQYDDDGIDVIFFDHSLIDFTNVTSSKIDEMFRKYNPNGSTDTAKAVKKAFDLYFDRKKKSSGGLFSKAKPCKPMIVICITDGEPDSKSELRHVIIDTTKKLDNDKELGITFVQVGSNKDARKFLKELDDDLQNKGAKFDIVDCKDCDEMNNCSIDDVLIGAVTD